MSTAIPKAKEVMRHASDITDRRARLRFIEIQMDAAAALTSTLWDLYSMQARELLDPLQDAARDVCAYDWSDNDEDAVDTIEALRKASS